MKQETMHFGSFQEMLDFVHGSVKPKELKEYKEPAKKKASKKAKKKEGDDVLQAD